MFLVAVYSCIFFEFIIYLQIDYEFTDMKKPSQADGIHNAHAMSARVATEEGAPPTVGLVAAAEVSASSWVASWQASPQPVWAPEFMFPSNVPAELRDQTVRQVARISLGGPRLRIVLSNAYGRQPIMVGRTELARPVQGRADGTVMDGSSRTVTFSGQPCAAILPGASLISDPVELRVPALAQIAVSIYLPQATPLTTFHWDGRQTGWIMAGDQTSVVNPSVSGSSGHTTTARPLLTGIQVEAKPGASTIVTIGDSITDGAAASLDADTRWPDFLAERLAPRGVAVANAGISGARLLSDGMGANALARLERDVLAQPGVRGLIVMLGINDIGWPGTAFARHMPRPALEALTLGYRQLIEQARSRGIRVMGATLTPFEGAMPGTPLADYYQPDKDALRQQVNDWMRHGGAFDAVIDFDAALRDRHHSARLAARFDSGDHLHPGDAGNQAMADAVDLALLVPPSRGMPVPHILEKDS